MAKPFLVVDLTNGARDFLPTSLDAGVPLLDRAGANWQILHRWLETNVAEPEWQRSGKIGFYITNENSARPENPDCKTVTEKDLNGPFRDSLQKLLEGIEGATANGSSEELLKRVATRELKSLVNDAGRGRERCCYFVKYRKPSGRWQLVWCPGYKQISKKPGTAVICTNGDCCQLFLSRLDERDKCPACNSVDEPKPSQPLPWKAVGLVTLLLLAIVLGYWFWPKGGGGVAPADKDDQEDNGGDGTVVEPTLVVNPEVWTGPVGSEIQFSAYRRTADGVKEDVSRDVVVEILDPRIADARQYELAAFARAPGKTVMRFNLGQLRTQSTLNVEQPAVPSEIVIEPSTLELSVGGTARLKLIGKYGNEKTADLTEAAQWSVASGDPLFAFQGLVEGLPLDGNAASMLATLTATYRPNSQSEDLTVQIPVTVSAAKPASLAIDLKPAEITVGDSAEILATAVGPDGKQFSVAESSQLSLAAEPDGIVAIDGRFLRGLRAGKVTLNGEFGGHKASAELTVNEPVASESIPFAVTPTDLTLVVGEVADVDFHGSVIDGTSMASTDDAIVRVRGPSQLIGVAPGATTIQVKSGNATATIDVTVVQSGVESIAFLPDRATVAIDNTISVRVVAILTDTGRQIDVAPDELEWLKFPSSSRVDVDVATLALTGRSPTGDATEQATVRYRGLQASLHVNVVGAPLQLVMTPAGEVQLPTGQSLPLTVTAQFGNGTSVVVEPNRLEWSFDPPGGLAGIELANGRLVSVANVDGSVKVKATYQDAETDWLTVNGTPATPVDLELTVGREPMMVVGDTGQARLTMKHEAEPDLELAEPDLELNGQFVTFSSADPSIIAVDKTTGGYRAIGAGTVELTGIFAPGSVEPASASLSITVGTPAESEQPTSVALKTDRDVPIELPIYGRADALRVIATYADGERDVTGNATFTVEHAEDGSAPVHVEQGTLVAHLPGTASVGAEFAGLKAPETIAVQVVDDFEIDGIRVEPADAEIAIGEAVSFAAIGLRAGQDVADMTDDPRIKWVAVDAADSEVLSGMGPSFTGQAAGDSQVLARLDALKSNPIKVSVRENPTSPLVVIPVQLTLQGGENAVVGTDVRVMRGDVDVTNQCQVRSLEETVVGHDPVANALIGGAAGASQVVFTLGNQTATLDVSVEPTAEPTGEERIVIEPQEATLAIGERIQPRVFTIDAAGERTDRTSSAQIVTDDPAIVQIGAGEIVALASGAATITATLPGLGEGATAKITVDDIEFTNLEIVPDKLAMSIGDTAQFQVFAIGPGGRQPLGDHPDLSVSLVGADGAVVSMIGANRLRAMTGGSETIQAKWRELESAELAVNVSDDPVTELVIEPSEITIRIGEEATIQVIGRRGDRVQSLTADDGVTLRIDDTAIAEVVGGLRLQGVSAGTTAIVATYGQQTATARLVVEPEDTPPAPRGEPTSIRFVPDIMRAEIGTPGSNFRLLQFYANGEEEDVAHLAEYKFEGPDNVVTIDQSPSGPIVKPLQIGQTSVHATVGELQTRKPLMIEVAESLRSQARVVMRPNPLVLQPGETARFSSVLVIPRNGGQPIELPYRLEATEPNSVEILPDNTIRALKAGRDLVNAVIVQLPDGKYHELEGTATVEVGVDPDDLPDGNTKPELVLTGPSQLTEGEEAQFTVELVNGSQRQTVSQSGAKLTLAAGFDGGAELSAGCRLVANKPGRIGLQARHGDFLSNVVEVEIRPVANGFQRLEVDVNTGPLAVSESRPYRVFGYPADGARQDLTGNFMEPAAGTDAGEIIITPEGNVVEHTAPTFVGRTAGTVTVVAKLGELESEPVTLVVVSGSAEIVELKIEPSEVTLGPGEESPELVVLGRSRGETEFRQVDGVILEIGTPSIVAAGSESGRFKAVATSGEAEITATHEGHTAKALIRIAVDPFSGVSAVDEIEIKEVIGKSDFTLSIDVHGGTADKAISYRCRLPERDSVTGWFQSKTDGEQQHVTIKTPPIPVGRGDKMYHLIIEARPADAVDESQLTRYPFNFRLGGVGIKREN
jgi:hypothetical protein